MKLHQYNLLRSRMNRRRMLQGAASLGAAATFGGVSTGISVRPAWADPNFRKELMSFPGVGMGQPGDAEWQRVGEMCMGLTRETVQPGEFAGVELTFMGLNNQNLHNFLFRGFLRPWEEYTGARLSWIDLAQADYNPRLQQSIATQTVDFDVLEMGAPFEGDVCGRGMASEMPGWVADLIEMDDYTDYVKAPVGTWEGRTYGVRIDGDCHNFNVRSDYLQNEEFAEAWAAEGHETPWGLPTTWQQVNAMTRFLKGRRDPMSGLPAHGYLDPMRGWGGFGFYFLMSRATAYAKHPDDPHWLFDENMTPRVNNPAFVRAIQDVMDLMDTQPADQINADPGTTGFQQFLAGTGMACAWWGDIGQSAQTSDTSVVGDVVEYSILPGSEDVWNHRAGQWETLPSGPNFSPNMAYIGWGMYVMSRVDTDPVKRKAAWSAAAHLGGKDLSLWTVAYPSGFQAYRNSHFNIDEWLAAGYDQDYIENFLDSQIGSYNHPNSAIEPRIPGIFQYYSVAEDELARGFAGQYGSAQETADAIAAAWERITDEIGRERQTELYRASVGL